MVSLKHILFGVVIIVIVIIVVVLLVVFLPDGDDDDDVYAPIVTLANGAQVRGIVQSVDDGTVYLYQAIKYGE